MDQGKIMEKERKIGWCGGDDATLSGGVKTKEGRWGVFPLILKNNGNKRQGSQEFRSCDEDFGKRE